MSHGHQHMSGGTQNQGNVLGSRSCVRQSKLYRKYESGNDVKAILGTSHLQWKTDKKEGAYAGHEVYDHERHHGYSLKNTYTDDNSSLNKGQSTNRGPVSYVPTNYLIKNMKIIGGKLVDVNKVNNNSDERSHENSNSTYTSHSYSNSAAHHHSNSNAFKATQPLNDSSNYSHNGRQQNFRNEYQEEPRRFSADDDIKERARKYIAQFEMRKENPQYDDEDEDMYDSRRAPPAYVPAAKSFKPVANNAVAFPGNRNTTGNSTRPW